MKRARVEMLYHLRCADCASAHRNLCRAIWRLQRSVRVDVGLLPASIPARPMHEHDFELHCLIQHTQRNRRPHALTQILMDAMVDGATTLPSREDVWYLAAQAGVKPTAMPRIAAEHATFVRHALERVTLLDPIQVPAFLIDDEHLLHGNASPAFIHDVLQTVAEPPRTTARNLLMGLSKWTSWTTSSIR